MAARGRDRPQGDSPMPAITAYVRNITRGATTIFEGMAVTFSHLLRPPITTQYPDRTPKPITDLIPERYRGFLWVDLDICISCRLCERACPIDCIKIEDEKIDKILVESRFDGKPTPKIKDPTRFDINLYKCMYCALCVEPCPTGAIFFTKEFEGASPDLSDMHLRLVDDRRRDSVLAAARAAEGKARAEKEAKARAETAKKVAAPAARADAAAPAAVPAAAERSEPALAESVPGVQDPAADAAAAAGGGPDGHGSGATPADAGAAGEGRAAP